MSARVRNALIDLAVVLVIGVHIAAFVMLWNAQRRFDDEALDIAEWAADQTIDRIGWPAELREAVPALMDADVDPVLIFSPVAPQHLAVNDVPVLVTQGKPRDAIAAIVTDQIEVGSLVASRLDLEAAATIPLDTGETAGEAIARPFVFAPLRASLEIGRDDPFTRELYLAPGAYVLAAEVFDPSRTTAAVLVAASEEEFIAAETFGSSPVVYEPELLEFEVSGDDPRLITIVVQPAPRDGSGSLLLHGWTVSREA